MYTRNKKDLDIAIKKIFAETFNIADVSDDDSIETISLWDSMGHMELISRIENDFNVRIDPEDIIKLVSVTSIKEFLRGKE
ncbi:MAG TPA: acyl carrier protein [Candidatus Omnitrophota bacterium]|nr:acyl carrier protein [Candidatus Omnitrophota bacterium]HPS19520.1 acyl carrier protein [Candidatus Omnitrophota bacterium]